MAGRDDRSGAASRREAAMAARRERARREQLTCRTIAGAPPVARFEVWGPSGRRHVVKWRAVWGAVTRCDCQDYETNGLGTCKHIEAVRLQQGDTGEPAPPTFERADADDVQEQVVFFDLETQRLFQDVGGRHHLDRLGVSLAVTYADADGGFHVWPEARVPELLARLRRAPLIVGFNLLQFDYEVLAGYGAEADELFGVPTLDVMVEMEAALGFRVGLDALAEATLGVRKQGSGAEAVEWFRQGALERLAEYCRADVALTRDLYRFGRQHGVLFAPDRRGGRVQAVARWAARRPAA